MGRYVLLNCCLCALLPLIELSINSHTNPYLGFKEDVVRLGFLCFNQLTENNINVLSVWDHTRPHNKLQKAV